MASKFGAAFMEISAFNYDQVSSLFTAGVRLYADRNKERGRVAGMRPPPPRSIFRKLFG